MAGENTGRIVNILFGRRDVNEFNISKKMILTINQVRNILYKLADEGLVSFVRKKDRKKGGWYIYYWTLNLDKSLLKLQDSLLKDLEHLKQQIHLKKTERFYSCENCGSEFNEENALLNNYTCVECGSILQLKDNSKEVLELEKKAKQKDKSLFDVGEELKILREKEDKNKMRKLRAEEKKKKKEKDAKKKAKKRETKRLIRIEKKAKDNRAQNKKAGKKKKR